MDSCKWTTLNVKQNLLKTKQNPQKTLVTLIRRRGAYTYRFSLGNNYNYIS